MNNGQARIKGILQSKWEKRLKRIHLAKICNAKSRIDMSNPLHFSRVYKGGKKDQLFEG